jgi:hypothetical protein
MAAQQVDGTLRLQGTARGSCTLSLPCGKGCDFVGAATRGEALTFNSTCAGKLWSWKW